MTRPAPHLRQIITLPLDRPIITLVFSGASFPWPGVQEFPIISMSYPDSTPGRKSKDEYLAFPAK